MTSNMLYVNFIINSYSKIHVVKNVFEILNNNNSTYTTKNNK